MANGRAGHIRILDFTSGVYSSTLYDVQITMRYYAALDFLAGVSVIKIQIGLK